MPMSFEISTGPHIRAAQDSKQIMWWVVFALMFPAVASIYFFGFNALLLLLFTTVVCVVSELVFGFFTKRTVDVFDGSAVVTGLLLAMVVPPSLPLWMAGVGAAFAIIIVKCLFGGLGFNIFNPALAARAMLLASWPVAMTTWTQPFSAITTASPLYLAKTHQILPDYISLFLGNRAGSLGETSVLALLIGAAILFWQKIIDWPAPFTYIGTVFLLTYFLGHDPVFYVLSGGLIIGAFFMATDYVTTPVTTKGRIIFGLGCGVLTVLIRFYGGFPEGVNYSILIMNILTPLIDKYSLPKLFGAVKKNG